MKKTRKKYSENKYSQLSELGSKLNLSFSSHMSLGSKVIALDGVKKKLLVSDISNVAKRYYTIDLERVEGISVRKNYSSIKPGELNKKEFGEFVETIVLRFEYRDGKNIVDLPFYERGKDRFPDLDMLERNARNWQMILSKMIVPPASELFTQKITTSALNGNANLITHKSI